jgi:DNA-binding winged helix-turn-helix (wHTH) protein
MIYIFADDYELDLQRYELRYAGKLVKLEPQVFNVLVYLIQHRDRVVSKDELLEQLWPGRFVSEATLTSRVMAARRAVGDRGREQRLIQTVHGRGYRFIAEVEERTDVSPAAPTMSHPPRHLAAPYARPSLEPTPHGGLVARKRELAALHQHFAQALQGVRQLVFLTGEAGIGKTALVDAFVAQAAAMAAVWIGQGQCLEQHGSGEAYLPLLEAL